MKKAFIFDIDGTIADNTHRLHFIQQSPKDWDSFFNNCDKDKYIEPVMFLIDVIIEQKRWLETWENKEAPFDIVFCTGRPECIREKTENWLLRGLAMDRVDIHLYMRSDGDHRSDSVVKEELIARMIEDGYEPFLVFEDRKRVVDMWRRNGITCLQCAEGDF